MNLIAANSDHVPSTADWIERMRHHRAEIALYAYDHAQRCLAQSDNKDQRWSVLIGIAKLILQGRGILRGSEARRD